jgi:hypothetical protein
MVSSPFGARLTYFTSQDRVSNAARLELEPGSKGPQTFSRAYCLRCEGSFDKGNCVRTNFCGGRQEDFSLIGLAGNLCYTLVVIAFRAPDSAAFQNRGFRAFGIAAAYKVVINIEREFDRDH